MKRSAAIICAFLLFAVFTWAQAKVITIGVDVSATGPSAALGVPNQNALLLAPHVLGGQKVRYVVLDDESDPATAVRNVKRLISQDDIDVLLGPSVTPTSMAVMETIATAKVPMFTFGSTSRLVLPMDAQKKWVFKDVPNDDIFCTALVDEMVRKGVKTISLIVVNDPYGRAGPTLLPKRPLPKGSKFSAWKSSTGMIPALPPRHCVR